jgi:hypothetical protein
MRVNNVNRAIIKETAEQFDQSLFHKFAKLDEWIAGTLAPTFNQLVRYAKTVDVPFGYFF